MAASRPSSWACILPPVLFPPHDLSTITMSVEWSDVFDPHRLPPGLASLLEDDLPPASADGGSAPLLPPFLSTSLFRDPLVDPLAMPAGRVPATDWAATGLVPPSASAAPVTTAVEEVRVTRVAAALPAVAEVAAVSAPAAVVATVPVAAAAACELRAGAPRLGVATPPSALGAAGAGAGGRATKKRRPPAPSALQLAAAQADAVRERFKAANKAAAAAAAAVTSPAAASVAVTVEGGRRGGAAVGDGGAASGGAASTATSAATTDAVAGTVPSFASSVSGGDDGRGGSSAGAGAGGGGGAPADGDATNAAKYERRLKMNRASAAASRLRHKTYISALEASVKAATAKNEEMVARLQQAWEENAALKARLEVALAGVGPAAAAPLRGVPPPSVMGGGGSGAGGGGAGGAGAGSPDDASVGGLGASCFS